MAIEVDEWTGRRFCTPPSAEAQREIDAEDAAWEAKKRAERVEIVERTELRRRVALLEQHASREALEQRDDSLCETIGGAVAIVVGRLRNEITSGSNSAPPVQDKGIWSNDQVYLLNEIVSDRGSAWLCR